MRHQFRSSAADCLQAFRYLAVNLTHIISRKHKILKRGVGQFQLKLWCHLPSEVVVVKERHSYFGVSDSSVLNIDLHWALLHVLVLIFVLDIQSPRYDSRPLKSHFVQLQWLLLLQLVFCPHLTDQQLSKFLTHLNAFVDVSHSSEQRSYGMSIIIFHLVFY